MAVGDTDHEMTTLADFNSEDSRGSDGGDNVDRRVELGSARYGSVGLAQTEPDADVENAQACQNCDASLPARYRRVQGDNDDVCHHCHHCVGPSAMRGGAGADLNHDFTEAKLEEMEREIIGGGGA